MSCGEGIAWSSWLTTVSILTACPHNIGGMCVAPCCRACGTVAEARAGDTCREICTGAAGVLHKQRVHWRLPLQVGALQKWSLKLCPTTCV